MVDQVKVPTRVKVSDIRKQFPMYEDLSDEQLVSGLRRKFYGDMPIGDFYGQIDFDTAKDKALKEAASEGSWLDRATQNLGAGFANVGQGIQQIGGKLGIGDGVTDDQIRDKRMRDDLLAENTRGGKALQIAGETLPTLIIPAGGAANLGARVTARALPRVAAALRAPGAVRTIADSAIQGAAGGALGPVTEDESRLLNAGIGGTIGALLPAALMGGRQAYRSLTREGGRDAAAQQLQQGATDLARAQTNLQQYAASNGPIPLSGSAAARDEGLAAIEAGQRARRGQDFAADDQLRAAAVARGVRNATAEADQIAARRTARNQGWNNDWAQVAGNVDEGAYRSLMDQLGPTLQAAARSPEAVNPAVRGVLEAIQSEIARVGPENFTPAHLQQIRANLNARGKPMPQNAWQAAPRESQAVNSIIDEIDSILNQSSGGRWQDVLNNYGTASRSLDEAKAASRARGQFWDDTGRARGVTADIAGDVPNVTEAGLSRALDSMRNPAGVSVGSQQARQGLTQTMEALRAQNILQRVKRSATAGGGSNTAFDNFQAAAIDQVTPAGWVGSALNAVRNVAAGRRNDALVEALRDPAQLSALLGRQVRSAADLSPREIELLRAITQTANAAQN